MVGFVCLLVSSGLRKKRQGREGKGRELGVSRSLSGEFQSFPLQRRTGTTSAGVSTNASTALSKVEACSALWRARASIEGSNGGEGRGDAAEVDDATINDENERKFRAL